MIRRIFLRPWFSVLFDGGVFRLGLDAKDFNVLIAAFAVLLFTSICKYRRFSLTQWLEKQGLWLQWAIYLAGLFFVLIYGVYGPGYDASAFIYFRF